MSISTAREIPIEYLVYKVTILKKALLIVATATLTGLFFDKGFSAGFLVGGLISMANFSLLARHIARMRGFSIGRAKRYIIGKFLAMYVIMAATLFIAATKGMTVFAGAAVGLFAIKFAIFIDGIFIKHAKSQ